MIEVDGGQHGLDESRDHVRALLQTLLNSLTPARGVGRHVPGNVLRIQPSGNLPLFQDCGEFLDKTLVFAAVADKDSLHCAFDPPLTSRAALPGTQQRPNVHFPGARSRLRSPIVPTLHRPIQCRQGKPPHSLSRSVAGPGACLKSHVVLRCPSKRTAGSVLPISSHGRKRPCKL